LKNGLSQVIVAIITSRVLRAGHPSRVTVQRSTTEGQRSGLLTDSVVMTDNPATIAGSQIDRVLVGDWETQVSAVVAPTGI